HVIYSNDFSGTDSISVTAMDGATQLTGVIPVNVLAPPPPAVPLDKASGCGDVHMATFDGVTYDMQLVGEFIAAKSLVPNDSYEVQIRTKPYSPGASVSVIDQIAAQVGTDRVTFGV